MGVNFALPTALVADGRLASNENLLNNFWDRLQTIAGNYETYAQKLQGIVAEIEGLDKKEREQLAQATVKDTLPYNEVIKFCNAIQDFTAYNRKIFIQPEVLDVRKLITADMAALGTEAQPGRAGDGLLLIRSLSTVDQRLKSGSLLTLGYNAKTGLPVLRKLIKDILVAKEPMMIPKMHVSEQKKRQRQNAAFLRHHVVRLAYWQMYHCFKQALESVKKGIS